MRYILHLLCVATVSHAFLVAKQRHRCHAVHHRFATTNENLFFDVVKEFGLSLPSKHPQHAFSYLLNQLSESQPEEAGPRAEILLRKHDTNHENSVLFLNKVLACYLKSVSTVQSFTSKRQLANKASNLLKEWPEKDLVSYNTLISIFSKAAMPQAARQTFDSLPMKPDTISYSALIHAYATTGRAREARQLFDTMLIHGPAPNRPCYNDVLNAYAKASDSFAAQAFLTQWERSKVTRRVKPEIRSYNIVLNALPWHKAEAFFASMPNRDIVSYTTMIAICCKARSNTDGALARIKQLIQQVVESDRIELTTTFLGNVLYSLGTMDGLEVANYAEQLALELAPTLEVCDIEVYNALLYCWSQQSQVRGERVLQLLEQIESDPNVQPDIKTYTSALNALKGRGDFLIPAAQDLMQRLETVGPAPTVATYTVMMQLYAKSNVPRKASSAWEIFQRMSTRNIVSYNAVLNACEYTDTINNGQTTVEEALKIACVVFDEIRHCPTSRPNAVTYGSFLGVLTNLMPTEASRQETVSLVFKRCAAEGQVSKYVLKKLQEAASADLYKELLQGYGEDRLPFAWTANVRLGKARKEF
jgi:pentatricopeptide repeat protein